MSVRLLFRKAILSPVHQIECSINTSATAYPSGSVKNPTTIVRPSGSSTLKPASPSRVLPSSHRSLPDIPTRKPFYISVFVVVASAWSAFIYFSTNSEKANSSVVKALLFELRHQPLTRQALGDPVQPEKDDAFGQLWVEGKINLMQGSVDVAFRVKGSQGAGKVYFTSVRRDRESEFEIVRWKLIRDDGKFFDLRQESPSISFQQDGLVAVVKPQEENISTHLSNHDGVRMV